MDEAIVKSDGTLWTWGRNLSGQLGSGTMIPGEQPVQVINLKKIVTLDFAYGAANAADQEGNIWFWGNHMSSSSVTPTILTPQKISFLNGIKQLQIAGAGVELLKESGTVWRIDWDYIDPTKYQDPEMIGGMVNIKKISGNLALQNNGDLCEFPDRAWRGPENGGLSSEEISDVQDLQNNPISHSIVLKNDNTVWTWGINPCGELGNGTFNNNPIPSKIDTLTDVIAISANGSRCLALKNDGTVWFWGLIAWDSNQSEYICQNKPMCIEELSDIKLIHASAVAPLLFMKSDSSFWSYDIKIKELKRIDL